MPYLKKPHISVQEVGYSDEVMVYDVERGVLHVINSVAAAILLRLEEPRTIEEIAASLLEEYDVDPTVARREISSIVDKFEGQGLIERVVVQLRASDLAGSAPSGLVP